MTQILPTPPTADEMLLEFAKRLETLQPGSTLGSVRVINLRQLDGILAHIQQSFVGIEESAAGQQYMQSAAKARGVFLGLQQRADELLQKTADVMAQLKPGGSWGKEKVKTVEQLDLVAEEIRSSICPFSSDSVEAVYLLQEMKTKELFQKCQQAADRCLNRASASLESLQKGAKFGGVKIESAADLSRCLGYLREEVEFQGYGSSEARARYGTAVRKAQGIFEERIEAIPSAIQNFFPTNHVSEIAPGYPLLNPITHIKAMPGAIFSKLVLSKINDCLNYVTWGYFPSFIEFDWYAILTKEYPSGLVNRKFFVTPSLFLDPIAHLKEVTNTHFKGIAAAVCLKYAVLQANDLFNGEETLPGVLSWIQSNWRYTATHDYFWLLLAYMICQPNTIGGTLYPGKDHSAYWNSLLGPAGQESMRRLSRGGDARVGVLATLTQGEQGITVALPVEVDPGTSQLYSLENGKSVHEFLDGAISDFDQKLPISFQLRLFVH